MSGWRMRSLVSCGSKYHLTVATALLTVLPLLSLLFIFWVRLNAPDAYPGWLEPVVGIAALGFGYSGYVLLRRYPRNIVHLRHYLQDIAAGQLPQKVTLEGPEDDIEAIERCMNTVVAQMRERVTVLEEQLASSRRMQQTIRLQARELIGAERQRVMIESLAAACHHIGQPATVLRVQLELLRRSSGGSPVGGDSLERCDRALDELAEVLEKLRGLNEYRTVPYRTYAGDGEENEPRIVDIRGHVLQIDPPP